MTLIAGVRCANGVVIGADGAATFAAYTQQTIRQPMHKLTVIRSKLIVGVSGPVGFSQRFAYHIEKAWDDRDFAGKDPVATMEHIRRLLWDKVIGPETQIASMAKALHGGRAVQSATGMTLLAMPVAGCAHLFEFDQQGSPEMASEDLLFKSIGSGQQTADPFLAFLKRVFWRDHCPNIAEGTVAVLWALQHAVHTSPGGVADPIQISILEKKPSDWVARLLEDAELEEHRQDVASLESSLSDWWKRERGQQATSDTDVPL